MPVLRFSEFSGEWDSLKLGDIAVFSKGKGISKADINADGTFECIRYGQLYTDYSETIRDVKSRTNIPAKELVLSEFNDIIIPASGETQIDIATASCVLKDGVALGGDLNIVKTDHDGVFLSYYLNSTRKYDIARLAQGISVVHLYATQLKTLHLNLPKANEQQKLASFLSSVDLKIEQLGKKKVLLEQYQKGVMQKLFSQELRFKDDQGQKFPDWEVKRLGEVFEERTERNSPNLEMLSVTLFNGIVLAKDLGRHDTSPSDKSKYKKVYKGDIAYNSMRMWQGASGVSKYEGIVSPAYTVISPLGKTSSTFFGYHFKLAKVIHIFQRHSQGLTSDTWNLKFPTLSRIKFDIPSLPEQQKIASFLTSLEQKKDLVSVELNHAKAFKKGLLQQIFI